MAERRPLVLIDGTPCELPSGDSTTVASHTHTAANITDSTTAGRTLLAAADAAAQRAALGLVIGMNVQAYDADTAKTNTAQTFSAKQTFSAGVNESWSSLSGTTPSITAGNHTWTLTGNSTPTDGLADGDSCTLMIDDGSEYTITWTSVVDVWMNGGSAPTLATTGYTGVVLWKVGTTVYAVEVPQ